MSKKFYLCQGERILLGPVDYNREVLGDALTYHGGSAADLPDTAPDLAIDVLYLRLLPEVDTTQQPSQPEYFHVGQAVRTVMADRVESQCPLTAYPLDYCATLLKEKVAAHRYSKQEAGITVDGVQVPTAKYDRDMLRDTVDELEAGTITSVRWKTAAGWLDVGLAELKPLRTAVVQHIQSCFSREADLCSQIDAIANADPLSDDWFDQFLVVASTWNSGWPDTLATS